MITVAVATLKALHLQHNRPIRDNKVLLTVIDRYSMEMISLGGVLLRRRVVFNERAFCTLEEDTYH